VLDDRDGLFCQHCGGDGEICCERFPACGEGLGCATGDHRCRKCGGADQPCCPGDKCDNGGCCVQGTCVADGAGCVFNSSPPVGTCQAGRCVGCGGGGERCCIDRTRGQNPCNDPFLLCAERTFTCVSCGGPDQPCCPANTCRDGGCCVHVYSASYPLCVAPGQVCRAALGDICTNGSCGACGGPGQGCCEIPNMPDVFCSAPNTQCGDPQKKRICIDFSGGSCRPGP
jgi:hypothetical protein